MGCGLNADVPAPKALPASPVAVEPKAPPVEAPRAGVPNPLGVPNPVAAPSPVVPKVPVLRDDPNAAVAARFVPPSPVAVPNGLLRAVPVAPKVPVKPVVLVCRLVRPNT